MKDAEHFRGCHPEHAESPDRVEPAEIRETEPCWHCGTLTTRGRCADPWCEDCQGNDYIPPSAMYHCPTCGRWWAWMTGLNITKITFGEGS
jgi:hypothetical protein